MSKTNRLEIVDGEFDELVRHNPELVHIERMDDGHIWMAVDGLHIHFHAKGKITVRIEEDA